MPLAVAFDRDAHAFAGGGVSEIQFGQTQRSGKGGGLELLEMDHEAQIGFIALVALIGRCCEVFVVREAMLIEIGVGAVSGTGRLVQFALQIGDGVAMGMALQIGFDPSVFSYDFF